MLDPLRQQWRALQAERELQEANRHITIAVQWRLPDGSTLLHAGGVWDAIDKRYLAKEPDRVRVIRLKESQVEAARWLAWWFQERRAGRKRDFRTLALWGDRGGGKTVMAVIGQITFLIMFPSLDGSPTMVWQVVSSYKERNEIEREIQKHFPFDGLWYTHRKAPELLYQFAHGPTLRTMSANKPDTLKQGTLDLIYYNEATKILEDAYTNGLPRLKDHDGLCILATNPPKSNRGRWVKKLYDEAAERKEAGRAFSVRFVNIQSKYNDSIHQDAADDVADQVRVLNPRLAQADIDGMMLPVDQPAYWEWSTHRNARSLPDLGDITAQYLKGRTGRAYPYLVGADFQGRPHMVAVICKIYGSAESPQIYVVDEIICPQATERDLAETVLEAGYTPDHALWIGDASGQWQNGKHTRTEYDSFRAIRDCGYHIQPPVRPKTADHRPANPPIEQRVGLINAMLKDGSIQVDRELAPRLADALKECILKENRHGRVIPVGKHAHITDALGYPVWWVYSKGQRKLPPGPLALIGDRPTPSLFG